MNDDQIRAITADTPAAELDDRAKRKEYLEVQHQQDLIWLLSDPRGKRFLLSLIVKTNAMGLGFHVDAAQMAFQQGRRAIGVEIMADLKSTVPRLYPSLFTDTVSA